MQLCGLEGLLQTACGMCFIRTIRNKKSHAHGFRRRMVSFMGPVRPHGTHWATAVHPSCCAQCACVNQFVSSGEQTFLCCKNTARLGCTTVCIYIYIYICVSLDLENKAPCAGQAVQFLVLYLDNQSYFDLSTLYEASKTSFVHQSASRHAATRAESTCPLGAAN